MEGATAAIQIKRFEMPDETRTFEGHGKTDIVHVGGHTVGHGVYEPGWHWMEDVKPIAGTDSCQISHLAYCVSGRMRITMDGGAAREIGAGDVAAIPPGHDAEVLGDEACVLLDFGEIEEYAKRH